MERETRFYLAFKISDKTAQSMFSAIGQLLPPILKKPLRLSLRIGGRSFPAILGLRTWEFPFILRMPLLLGKEKAMKTLMDYCENIFRRNRI